MVTSTRFFSNLSADTFERISALAGGDGLTPPQGCTSSSPASCVHRMSFANVMQDFDESMVASTVASEMSALSDPPRNSTVIAEHPSVLWKLSNENIQRLQIEKPAERYVCRIFIFCDNLLTE